jgi:hypothetical protein
VLDRREHRDPGVLLRLVVEPFVKQLARARGVAAGERSAAGRYSRPVSYHHGDASAAGSVAADWMSGCDTIAASSNAYPFRSAPRCAAAAERPANQGAARSTDGRRLVVVIGSAGARGPAGSVRPRIARIIGAKSRSERGRSSGRRVAGERG